MEEIRLRDTKEISTLKKEALVNSAFNTFDYCHLETHLVGCLWGQDILIIFFSDYIQVDLFNGSRNLLISVNLFLRSVNSLVMSPPHEKY